VKKEPCTHSLVKGRNDTYHIRYICINCGRYIGKTFTVSRWEYNNYWKPILQRGKVCDRCRKKGVKQPNGELKLL